MYYYSNIYLEKSYRSIRFGKRLLNRYCWEYNSRFMPKETCGTCEKHVGLEGRM